MFSVLCMSLSVVYIHVCIWCDVSMWTWYMFGCSKSVEMHMSVGLLYVCLSIVGMDGCICV